MQTLVIGLGRSGRGLHLPVLARARASTGSRHLFAELPVLAYDPGAPDAIPPGTVRLRSLAQAASGADPARTVVHLCTPPTVRVEVLDAVARLGFRKVLVEKPLAIDGRDLAQMIRLRRRWGLDLLVVAPWRVSTLTRRLEQILAGGTMGALRSISVVQRKPRFTRSLAGSGDQCVFDVETPHAVGLVIALAGSARVRDAAWTDMKIGERVLPGMGTGWLSLDHDRGVRTELLSDLTAPTRERRITLQLERGSLVGHYACSEDDHTAQLTVTTPERQHHMVFHDDALTSFVVAAYEHFAGAGRDGLEPLLDAEVVRVLDEAKRRCLSREGPRVPVHAVAARATTPNGPTVWARPRLAHVVTAGSAGPPAIGPAVRFAGIGDEAGVGLPDQIGSLARLGWTAIELRTVDGLAVGDLDDAAFGRLVETLQAYRCEVVGVASRIGNWSRPITGDFREDLRELEVLERRCPELGTRNVRVMSYPNAGLTEQEWGRRAVERMRRLAGRAERAGLVLVHENCSGWAGAHAKRMLALLEAVDSPALRLLFDTGNGVAYRYDAYELLNEIVEHVTHVHIKDATGSAEQPVYTLPGTGRARVAECLRLLLDRGYVGWWSIEPHLAVQPHQALQGSTSADGAPRVGPSRPDSFVASGRALEELVRDQVLPTFPQWTTIPGGIVRRREE